MEPLDSLVLTFIRESLDVCILCKVKYSFVIQGVTDIILRDRFPDRYKELPDAIGSLVKKRQISRFKQDNQLTFEPVSSIVSGKLAGLG